MTDLMLKTLQHHVNEKKPVTQDELIAKLMWRCDAFEHKIKSLERQVKSLEQWRAGANKLSE